MRQFVEITSLPHGILVASERMPGAYSVSVGLWVGVGSAYEQHIHNGVSHFFEHMVFKGTQNRSSLQLAHEIEERGGSLNAYTTREQTCFYARTVKEDFSLALDTICDLAMNPLLEDGDIIKERKVIIEEIRSYEDSPDELAHDLFCEQHFTNSGLSMPITGTLKTVKSIDRKALLLHHDRILSEFPIVIVASGNVNHQELVGKVRTYLSKKSSTTSVKTSLFPGTGTGAIVRTKDVSQCNITAGTSIPVQSIGHQRMALSVLNIIFGDGMSSRLFQRVREQNALAYSVFSSVDNYRGCRSFNISLGTDPKRQQKAIDLVNDEVRKLRKHGITMDELTRAKTSILGSIKLGLDSPSNRMNRLARQLLRSGKYTPFSALEKELVKVGQDEVMAVIEDLFCSGHWAAAAVQPKENKSVDLSPLLFH